MFGTYRTLLALFVVIGHLHGPFHLGVYAVFGFYMLSGYLMTRIMQETYGYDLPGRGRFAVNRVLRIYPCYWVVAIATLGILATTDGALTEYHPRIHFPGDAAGWARNVGLVFEQASSPRLSPATWALTVELFYYALIGFGLSRTPQRSALWLAASVIYTIGLFITSPYDWEARYFPIPAASLPFAIGACLYHYRSAFERVVSSETLREPGTWFALVCVNFSLFYLADRLTGTSFKHSLMFGFYLNLLLTTGCLTALVSKGFLELSESIDTALGRYSYPVYLTHWLAGGIVASTLFADEGRQHTTQGGVLFFLAGLLVALGLSWLLIRLVDDPIERFRGRIRARSTSKETA